MLCVEYHRIKLETYAVKNCEIMSIPESVSLNIALLGMYIYTSDRN